MKILLTILLLLLFPYIVSAGDEVQINELLKNGGHITLENKVYEITGPIYIHSNTVLSGSSGTILRVSCPNGRWFSNSIGIINGNGIINNVEISGFTIDGDCDTLPFEYSRTSSNTAHDCESLIHLVGDSNNFISNVKIHNMKLVDAFSDGITIRFGKNIECYDNFISNCEHEGIFYSCATDSRIYNNKIAGITSDCLRLDNSERCIVENNTLFSYNGPAAVTYVHGENGLQIANGGSSHGYNAANKPTSTQNIEVRNNIFADNGLKAIVLDSVALMTSSNVFIHDNTFLNKEQLETSGIAVDIGAGMPTITQSEKVFSSIFDILSLHFTEPDYHRVNSSLVASITEYNNTINPHSLVSVNYTGLENVNYEYKGNNSTWLNGTWQGTISHQGNALYLDGPVNQSELKITCYTKTEYFEVTNFTIVENKWKPTDSFKPWVYIFITILFIFIFYIRYILKYYF